PPEAHLPEMSKKRRLAEAVAVTGGVFALFWLAPGGKGGCLSCCRGLSAGRTQDQTTSLGSVRLRHPGLELGNEAHLVAGGARRSCPSSDLHGLGARLVARAIGSRSGPKRLG